MSRINASLSSLCSKLGIISAVAAASLSVTPSASAQDAVNLDAFRSSVLPGDGFAISRPDDFGHGRFAAQLQLDYAHNPLIAEQANGDRTSLVRHHLVGNLTLAVGAWNRAIFYAQLPASLVMSGDTLGVLPTADGTRIGDPIVGARVRLYGEQGEIFALALNAAVSFPLARAVDSNVALAGESGFVFIPSVLAEVRLLTDEEYKSGRLRITGNLGARVRDATRQLADLNISHELTYGANVTFGVIPQLDVMAEVWGSLTFEDIATMRRSPFEIVAGLRGRPGAGFTLGIAGGGGPVGGYGSPDGRVIGTIGWAMEEASPVVEEVIATVSDTDNDGLNDNVDQCPNEAEDRDNFEDENGCPDADNDQDGVPDANDGAPNDAEDRDGFQDEDGVPDPDNDNDGVPDANDGAPNAPEDRDNFQDADGVPDPDNDGDTIADGEDECPNAPGPAQTRGCPRTIRLEEGRITILQRIEFANNSDVLLAPSFPILEEIRSVLTANPQITLVRVEGHTDDRGNDARNMDLSNRRAQSVVKWLTDHGIAAARLEAQGFGETRPLVPNTNNASRQQNRRVEFNIPSATPAAAPAAN